MRLKYETTVSAVGPMAVEFAAEGILVFFGTNAPEELHEFAILHEHTPNDEDVKPGDKLAIDESEFVITGVGDVANDNLRNLGHLVVKFNGLTETELPGEVSVTHGDPPNIEPGTHVRIIAGD
jgi:PTS system glucitol/sorbitol-specific IIA component